MIKLLSKYFFGNFDRSGPAKMSNFGQSTFWKFRQVRTCKNDKSWSKKFLTNFDRSGPDQMSNFGQSTFLEIWTGPDPQK